MRKQLRALFALIFAVALTSVPVLPPTLAALSVARADPADAPELINSVAVDGFRVLYPDGWSTLKSGRLTMILDVPAEQQESLGDRLSSPRR